MIIIMLSKKNYNIKSWAQKYPSFKVNLKELNIVKSWKDFFDDKSNDQYFERLHLYLTKCLNVTKGQVKIYPYPDLVFEAFNKTPLNKVNVVIIGQDPYFKNETLNNDIIPQAMGLSFSVPVGIKIPSSLKNIYKNLINFGHIKNIPNHGNLISWANQGTLLLNATLTVQHGHKNSHQKFWADMTDKLIKYISSNTNNVVFVLWGSFALKKYNLIDKEKHKILISSHPSGLSYKKPLGKYKPFYESDHFGEINEYLASKNKKPILWDIK